MFKFLWLKMKLTYNCLSSVNWNCQIANSCFLEEFDPIVPNIGFKLFDRYWSHIQYKIPISWFSEDIDFIFKIFKNWWDGSSGFFGPCLFQILSKCWSSDIFTSLNEISEKTSGFPWIIWKSLVSPKFKIIGGVIHGRVPKSENHENEGCSGFPKVKSTSY